MARAQGRETYGSTASLATVQNDEYFAGTGIVTVPSTSTLPMLSLVLSAPNVILSWPTNAAGFVLQGIGAFGATWTDDDTAAVISDKNYTVTEAAPTNEFFRQKKSVLPRSPKQGP